MKGLIFILLIIAIGGGAFYYFKNNSNTKTQYDVTLTEGKVLADNPEILILDVRPKKDLVNGVLHNAINIDVTQPEFKEALQKLDKNKEYLVYCNVGQRSAKAIKEMEEAGFTKLHHIKDGIVKWKEAGYPIDVPSEQK